MAAKVEIALADSSALKDVAGIGASFEKAAAGADKANKSIGGMPGIINPTTAAFAALTFGVHKFNEGMKQLEEQSGVEHFAFTLEYATRKLSDFSTGINSFSAAQLEKRLDMAAKIAAKEANNTIEQMKKVEAVRRSLAEKRAAEELRDSGSKGSTAAGASDAIDAAVAAYERLASVGKATAEDEAKLNEVLAKQAAIREEMLEQHKRLADATRTANQRDADLIEASTAERNRMDSEAARAEAAANQDRYAAEKAIEADAKRASQDRVEAYKKRKKLLEEMKSLDDEGLLTAEKSQRLNEQIAKEEEKRADATRRALALEKEMLDLKRKQREEAEAFRKEEQQRWLEEEKARDEKLRGDKEAAAAQAAQRFGGLLGDNPIRGQDRDVRRRLRERRNAEIDQEAEAAIGNRRGAFAMPPAERAERQRRLAAAMRANADRDIRRGIIGGRGGIGQDDVAAAQADAADAQIQAAGEQRGFNKEAIDAIKRANRELLAQAGEAAKDRAELADLREQLDALRGGRLNNPRRRAQRAGEGP